MLQERDRADGDTAHQQGLLPRQPGSVNSRPRQLSERAQRTQQLTNTAATLDVKLKAPNGTNLTVKGKQGFDGVTSGSVSSLRGRDLPSEGA